MPKDVRSCHTAQVDKYLIEGHVPAEDIQRLLQGAQGGGPGGARHAGELTGHGRSRRAARALRGVLFQRDGKSEVFAKH